MAVMLCEAEHSNSRNRKEIKHMVIVLDETIGLERQHMTRGHTKAGVGKLYDSRATLGSKIFTKGPDQDLIGKYSYANGCPTQFTNSSAAANKLISRWWLFLGASYFIFTIINIIII